MFENCFNFNQPLNDWNLYSLKFFNRMLCNCPFLKSNAPSFPIEHMDTLDYPYNGTKDDDSDFSNESAYEEDYDDDYDDEYDDEYNDNYTDKESSSYSSYSSEDED